MAKMAEQIELNESSVSKRKRQNSRSTGVNNGEAGASTAPDMTMNGSAVEGQIARLMQQMDDRPDLFYLHGDEKYPGPGYYSQKFKESGLKMPCFLLPPSDENHIPPHIVA